ncbi:MAG: hypothetical protein ACRDWA_05845 [Acidimicrobiia bacterium]
MRFSGTLQTQGDPEGWLKASLNLVGGRVEIVAGDETLGSWSVAQVKAERIEGNRFDLFLGDDRAVFVADDALAFSYEALPKLAKNPIVEVAQGFRLKLKGSSRKAAKTSDPAPVEPPPVSAPSLADNIVWQDPPPEAPANVKRLRELIEAARANRTEEDSEELVEAPEAASEPEVAVLAIDPPMMLVDPADDPEPEPLWAGNELGRWIKPPVEDPTDIFTPRPEATPVLIEVESIQRDDLVNELEQLLKLASTGNLSEAQVEAAAGLVRSLRTLLDK